MAPADQMITDNKKVTLAKAKEIKATLKALALSLTRPMPKTADMTPKAIKKGTALNSQSPASSPPVAIPDDSPPAWHEKYWYLKRPIYATKSQARSDVIRYIEGFTTAGAVSRRSVTGDPTKSTLDQQPALAA